MNKLLTLETLTMETNYKPTVIDNPIEGWMQEIAALETAEERDNAYTELLQTVNRDCRSRFVRAAAEEGLQLADLHAVYGTDYTLLCKILAGDKCLTTNIMADVCDRFLHMSANELVFGVPSRIVVPNALNAVIHLAGKDPAPDFQVHLREVLTWYADRIPSFRSEDPIPPELVHERLREITDETGLNLQQAGGRSDWSKLLGRKQPIRPEFMENPVPTVKRLVGFSIRWRRPIDYFIARDYTKRSRLYYRHGRELHRLTSGLYISLVSVYLRLAPEDRERMVAELLASALAA